LYSSTHTFLFGEQSYTFAASRVCSGAGNKHGSDWYDTVSMTLRSQEFGPACKNLQGSL
jgi:hypothetical protein